MVKLGLVSVLVSLVAAAFGVAPTPHDGAGAAAEHVHIQGFAYSPTEIRVAPGTTVEWDNHDTAHHNVAADDGSWESPLLARGESWSRTFDEPGTYDYHCDPHPQMTARVIVEKPEDPGPPNVPPTVAFTTPTPGQVVGGLLNVTGTAADADGSVARVDVALDGGAFVAATGTTSWILRLDTAALVDGEHVLRARSFDGLNFSAIATRTFTVSNPEFPDLVLVDLRITAGATRQTITADVRNDGNAPAPAFEVAFQYLYKGEARAIGAKTVPAGLAPGATATVTFSWDTLGKLGRFTVEAIADAPAAVEEWDEGNNAARGDTSVLVNAVGGVDAREP